MAAPLVGTSVFIAVGGQQRSQLHMQAVVLGADVTAQGGGDDVDRGNAARAEIIIARSAAAATDALDAVGEERRVVVVVPLWLPECAQGNKAADTKPHVLLVKERGRVAVPSAGADAGAAAAAGMQSGGCNASAGEREEREESEEREEEEADDAPTPTSTELCGADELYLDGGRAGVGPFTAAWWEENLCGMDRQERRKQWARIDSCTRREIHARWRKRRADAEEEEQRSMPSEEEEEKDEEGVEREQGEAAAPPPQRRRVAEGADTAGAAAAAP
eukprot:gene2474-2656_t